MVSATNSTSKHDFNVGPAMFAKKCIQLCHHLVKLLYISMKYSFRAKELYWKETMGL
jgi:hypothetical protein